MIIGYGLTTAGEAGRYMKRTLDEFKRLCDRVIILGNNATEKEKKLVESYGFDYVSDRREWGKLQWRIKQDFIERNIKPIARNGDILVCLDMDEVFCNHLTKQWLRTCELDAYYVFFNELWNDENHYKSKLGFWNVRIWRWNGDTKWKTKPLHCGLAPEWTYRYHRFAPFVVDHYGTMKKEDRDKKIARYRHYDPDSKYLERDAYYKILEETDAEELNRDHVCDIISKEVSIYQQKKPKTIKMEKKPKRYAYLVNAGGLMVDVPEAMVEETLKKPGFKFVEWVNDSTDDMEQLFGAKSETFVTETPNQKEEVMQEIINKEVPELKPKRTRKTK